MQLRLVSIHAFLFCLSVLLLSQAVFGQHSFTLNFEWTMQAKFIAADPLGKLYVVTPSNELRQYAPDGSLLYKYNNNTLGELTRVDATDPFQVMLYYNEYQTVVILDRTLNLLSSINLWEFGIRQPLAPAMSNDNMLWVYDHADFRLRKLDRHGNPLHDSGDLNSLLNATPRPAEITARHNLVVLNDPNIGLLLFDNFGQYLETLPFPGCSQVQLPEPDRILFYCNRRWKSYHIELRREVAFNLPSDMSPETQIVAVGNYIFALHGDKIHCWSR